MTPEATPNMAKRSSLIAFESLGTQHRYDECVTASCSSSELRGAARRGAVSIRHLSRELGGQVSLQSLELSLPRRIILVDPLSISLPFGSVDPR